MEKLSRDLLRVSRKAQICVGAVVKKYNITVAEEPFLWLSILMMVLRRKN